MALEAETHKCKGDTVTFTPNMPASGQSLGTTRPLVQGNFEALYNTIEENHYPPNDALDGKHKVAVFHEQIVSLVPPESPPTTAVNEAEIYALEFNSRTELMYRPENTAFNGDQWALSGVPWRAYGFWSTSAAALGGSSFNLAIADQNNNVYDITFTTQFPIGAATANYGIIISPQTNTQGVVYRIQNKATTGFRVNFNSTVTIGFTVLVMGG